MKTVFTKSLLVVFLFILLKHSNGYSQKTISRNSDFDIVGLWHSGICSGAELSGATFRFYANGEYVYVPDGIDPNPVKSIKGRYKVEKDSSGYSLQLNITSFEAVVGYKIDADAPDETRWGVFGLSPDTLRTTTFTQTADTFHAHRLNKCKTVKEKYSNDFSCPCILIDQYSYYKRSVNKGYEND